MDGNGTEGKRGRTKLFLCYIFPGLFVRSTLIFRSFTTDWTSELKFILVYWPKQLKSILGGSLQSGLRGCRYHPEPSADHWGQSSGPLTLIGRLGTSLVSLVSQVSSSDLLQRELEETVANVKMPQGQTWRHTEMTFDLRDFINEPQW